MAEGDEIKQRVSLETDQFMTEAARLGQALERLEREVAETGDAAQEAARKDTQRQNTLAGLRQRLEELIRQEVAHEQAVRRGANADDVAERESRERRDEIDRVSRALAEERAVQDRVNQSIQEAGESSGLFTAATDKLLGAVASLTAGLVGVGGLQRALQVIRQEMDETARKAQEVAEASLNLQFLSQKFSEQERAFVGEAAAFAGRGLAETTTAFADLKSRFPQLSDQDLQALFLEVAESGRTTTAPMTSLVDAFSTIRQFEQDPQRAQNILRETIVQAGVSDPGQISPLLARFLGVGTEIAGLSAGQAAGAVAAATGLGLSPEESVTALRNTALALAGKGTPEGREILDRAGVSRGDFFQSLRDLSGAVQSGQIQKEDLETIGGREAISLLSLLSDPTRLDRFIGSAQAVGAAQTTDRDLTGEAVSQQVRQDPRLAMTLAIRQERTRIERLRAEGPESLEALERELANLTFERAGIESGLNPVTRAVSGFEFDLRQLLGQDAVEAADKAGGFGLGEQERAVAETLGTVRGGGVVVNVVNVGQQYNLNNDGTSRATEDSGRRDLP